MTDSFNYVYGKHDDPFYYGLRPSTKLEQFLNDTDAPTGEALDLGCGEGRNSLLLAGYGFQVHAIDASRQGIQKLEHYAASQGLHTIDCSVADVRTVQPTPNTYDAIVAVTILDHIAQQEGKKVAASLIDALKPGGFIFVETFTVHDPGAKLSKEEGKSISETPSFFNHSFVHVTLPTLFPTLEPLL